MFGDFHQQKYSEFAKDNNMPSCNQLLMLIYLPAKTD